MGRPPGREQFADASRVAASAGLEQLRGLDARGVQAALAGLPDGPAPEQQQVRQGFAYALEHIELCLPVKAVFALQSSVRWHLGCPQHHSKQDLRCWSAQDQSSMLCCLFSLLHPSCRLFVLPDHIHIDAMICSVPWRCR